MSWRDKYGAKPVVTNTPAVANDVERAPGSSGGWRQKHGASPVSERNILDQLASPSSVAGTALQHFGQGASFGLTDEMSGLTGVQDEFSRRVVGMPTAVDEKKPLLTALLERYRMERDSTRADLKKGADANPGTAFTSGLAGALMVPVPGPGKAKAGASILSRVLPYAGQGVAVGTAYGVGTSDADLTKGEFGKFADDVAASAEIGGVAGGAVGPVVEKAATSASNYLLDSAADKAFKAMNGNAKIVDKAAGMGIKGEERLRALGRWALEKGLIPWSGDPAEIVARTEALLDKIGPKIGDVSRRADDQGVVGLQRTLGGSIDTGFQAPMDAASGAADYARAQKAAGGAVEPMSPLNMEGLTAEDLANTGAADKFIERIAAQGKQTPGSFEGMARNKTAAQRGVFWGDKPTAAREIHRDAVQRYTQDFEEQIGEMLGPKDLAELKGLNKDYAQGTQALDFASDTARRGAQGKYKNPIAAWLRRGSLVSGGGAVATGFNPLLLAASGGSAALAKALDNPGLMAHLADAAGGALAKGPTSGATKLSAIEANVLAEWLRGKKAP